MQLLLMALILGLFIYDAADGLAWWTPGPATAGAIVLAPKLALGLLYWLACRNAYRRLSDGRAAGTLTRLERLTGAYRLAVLFLFFNDLMCGGLAAVRGLAGNLILVDELLILAPTLAALAWAWWAYYPIDRRLREAALIREIDSGAAFKPIWSRWGYLGVHIRHEAALILAPLLIILAWYEAVPVLMPDAGAGVQTAVRLIGSLGVFLLAPLVIRYLWDTVPLPAGEVRVQMEAMCRQHRVGVRDVLLWRTRGGMINAAVMGLVGPLRYILLTDGLLEKLHRPQVEAVMAHELAHVRRRHMFWLIAAALGLLGSAELVLATLLWSAADTLGMDVEAAGWADGLAAAAAGGAALVWALAFGWVSRRIERQADTYAVQHLVAKRDPGRLATVDEDSVRTMVWALQSVADLNHVPARKHNWRHGSIAWRQAYLRSLVGRKVSELSIDRQMNWIKLATLAALGIVTAAHVLLGLGPWTPPL